jgi:YidC/Oxa1 family membrane protein insertase
VAIVMLTVAVRIVLLPLAVKQINSMRGMQRLQPEIKKVQAKYKTDREMMKKNPEKYRERRQKQQEEMMALYKEHGVNPAAGCLPLLLQMPIFFALFRLLQYTPEGEVGVRALCQAEGAVRACVQSGLEQGRFLIIEDLTQVPNLASALTEPGALLLVILMGASTFYSQKQMMASNPGAGDNPQQKILLYVMPVMLLFFAFNMPVGVLLYWVTTNVWTILQQFVMFRRVDPAAGAKTATA